MSILIILLNFSRGVGFHMITLTKRRGALVIGSVPLAKTVSLGPAAIETPASWEPSAA
jgi:hypothetical protein